MVLKVRYSDGRTNYTDIGNNFMYIQKNSVEFDTVLKREFDNPDNAVDCLGFIEYEKTAEPIYKDFPCWIYSNNGSLFMTLVPN